METSFHADALKMRERLKAVSPSFCLAKWLQASLQLTTGRTQSCYHPKPHRVPEKTLSKDPSALHNTEYKMKQRAAMLQGKRPTECATCWAYEDQPGNSLSDRHYRSAEAWSAPAFEDVLRAGASGRINPRSLEVNFSSACQMKCSYCSPAISSSWLEEIREHGKYKMRGTNHNSLFHFKLHGTLPRKPSEPNPYVDAFWAWWPELYRDLSVFRMTGGEPLLDSNTFRVMDYVGHNPKPDLSLAVTSNFSVRDEIVDRFIARAASLEPGLHLQRFQLYVSCDSVGARAEYSRFGLNYERFMSNVRRFLQRVPGSSVTFIVTMHNLSVGGWKDLLQEILLLRAEFGRDRIYFDTPILREPRWQSLRVLPRAQKERFASDLETLRASGLPLYDYEDARLRRNFVWMSEDLPTKDLRRDRANFFLFFSEHDRRRGTDFLATFPDLADFWALCRAASGF